jgi:hypothetical protein
VVDGEIREGTIFGKVDSILAVGDVSRDKDTLNIRGDVGIERCGIGHGTVCLSGRCESVDERKTVEKNILHLHLEDLDVFVCER